MAEIVATTERLVLRRWVPGDFELWLAHLNTPEVRFCLGGVETPEKVAEKFARLERAWDEDGFSFLAVELRQGRTFLGTCGLARITTGHAPAVLEGAIQIGWQLRADYWRLGYAGEAARAMLAYGFGALGLDLIYAQTSQRNLASWGLMEKLGMTRMAGLDYEDSDYPPEDNPTMVYRLKGEDWQQ